MSGRDGFRAENPNALQLYVRLPHGPLGTLAGYHLGGEAWRFLFYQDTAEVTLLIAGPDYSDVGEGAVADLALLSVYEVLVALLAHASF